MKHANGFISMLEINNKLQYNSMMNTNNQKLDEKDLFALLAYDPPVGPLPDMQEYMWDIVTMPSGKTLLINRKNRQWKYFGNA